MNKPSNLRRKIGLAALVIGAAISPLQAQSLDALAQSAGNAMKTNDWPTALADLTKATDSFDARALTLYGPRFGWFWFRRGIAELKLGKYEDAMRSFENAHEKYKNIPAVGENRPSVNMNEKMALLYHGHAAKASKEWKKVIEMYDRFMKERDPTRDKVNLGLFYTNRAYANFKLKQFERGVQDLEKAIENKVVYKTTDKAIMGSFVAMAESVIEKKQEGVLLNFLEKNRGHVKLTPVEAYEFAPLFMKLAAEAKEAEMMRSVFEFYSLVPSTMSALHDAEGRLSLLGSYPGTIADTTMTVSKVSLTEDRDELEKQQKSGQVNEIYAALNTAVMHEEDGNVRGAYAVYDQMERYFPDATIMQDGVRVPMRERNLYHLVRTSSALGEVLTTEKYGSRFLKAFPNSKYVPEVRRMMLTSLFWNGEYELCIKVASKLLPELKDSAPSKQHDICLFVLGGSRFYNGDFIDAQALLDAHTKMYPDADEHRRKAALYFQASNLTRLGDWVKSGALLDTFLKEYPDPKKNPYYPFALFDRANVHYSSDEYEESLAKLNRIETEFPGAELMEQVYNLKGNVLEQLDQNSKAIDYHKKALQLSETKKNKPVAAEALYHLVRLLGDPKSPKGGENQQMTDALPFYDKFWEEHGGESNYDARVAVAGLPAMNKADRTKEALERLQGVIVRLSSTPNSSQLEPVINSYTEAYLKSHSPDELKEHFYNFPGIDSRDQATRALLRIAVINVFEDVAAGAEKEKNADGLSKAQAQVKVLFNELKSDFKFEELSPYILVSVGDFLRTKTTAPQQGVPFYKEALRRDGHDYKFNALFGLANVLADGGDSQKREAITYLDQVIQSSDSKAQKEEALYKIIMILSEQGNTGGVVEKARTYLENPNYRKFSAVVRLELGLAYDQAGKREDAMAVLAQVWATNMGYIQVSAPAIQRWMALVWDRNGTTEEGKSDRQLAYESGFKYIEQTEKFQSRLKPEELRSWLKVKDLVEEYEARAETTPMAELRAEKK